MSGQEMPKDDHKENPAESSPPTKKSTIRNIFKSFPTPSIKNIKGFHQAHGAKGSAGGTSTSRTEESIPSGGSRTVGLSDDKPDAESNLKMLKREEGGEKGGGECAVDSPLNTDITPTLLNQGGGEQEGAAASQHKFDRGPTLPIKRGEEGDATASQRNFGSSSTISSQEEREGAGASQHTFDCNSELLNRGEEEGEKGRGDREGETAASQPNSATQEENDLPPTTLKDDEKRDKTSETRTTEDTLVEPVTHSFSFRLSEPPIDPEPQPDSSSESHALTTSTTTPSLNQTHPAAGKPRTKSKKQKGLSSARDGKDSDSSVCSRKRSSKGKTKIKSKFAPGSLEYIEERLRGRIFSGWVEERQWVESVGGYRDVIEVDEWEVEMNQQLQTIISSIPGVQDGTRWINITPPDKSPYYRLWVLLEAPPTPGHYWYTVTGTRVQPQFGLMISVKEIRSIHPYDGELAEARRKRMKKKAKGGAQSELESVSEVLQDFADQFTSLRPATILSTITSAISLSNIKETIRFITVLLMTLVIGLVTFLRESHVVGLRFVREAGIFVHNATPFLQTVLGFFEKIVGGLYLLVAMVYRDFRRPSVPPPRFPPPPPPSLTSSPPRPATGPRAIQYVSPERWVVKTPNNDFT
ncbi:uncharacterized protein LOC127003407 isoform X1 [Eriocheir sinensis]|uniref:uncharacterized protein LOC127003407 isoform X1 n=1 Tax=Eriocheir sinensis TaxID=95602 RepID=UPI0021C9BD60|nr:uncharacterized protein LOC127003407 isoform X1 [Eriocheir sinensis]XP_050725975.1 uncharacterized protein LOC127003407 isoform X1 [Eriocheir sinensis]XP_050725976.1 uncharacterized protein LOC127003407 isoform X1 [Eriocheir sinensis]XP_050725977.1 uncharacterized protein LOC127003407 isoform X1 [Eriocheir sinensis]XP_050725978.1 uncharacterized protein LOC127003407 isoform X1 [Eriocheir sinensis]XP_050725979.1 uncharacterized protein LOC127003407 isoform X1 [Eriocheir sinensis]XP_05072598